MKIIKILIGLLVIANLAMAANNVEVHINYPSDTVFIGSYNKLEVWIENDVEVAGVSLGFEVSGSLGTINWMQDYGDYPPFNREEGFRGYFSAFMSNTYGLDDMILPDSILVGAITIPPLNSPMPPGSIRPCFSLYFYVPDGEDPGELCVDNIFVSTNGDWIFAPPDGGPFPPSYSGCPETDPQNPACPAVCFPVETTERPCGDVNSDMQVNLNDPINILNYIMHSASISVDYAFTDVNCDGRVNIADAEFLMEYFFIGGPIPCSNCP